MFHLGSVDQKYSSHRIRIYAFNRGTITIHSTSDLCNWGRLNGIGLILAFAVFSFPLLDSGFEKVTRCISVQCCMTFNFALCNSQSGDSFVFLTKQPCLSMCFYEQEVM